jgi:hypothetical protein
MQGWGKWWDRDGLWASCCLRFLFNSNDKKQIPFGDDKLESQRKSNDNDNTGQRQRQEQILFGRTSKKGKGGVDVGLGIVLVSFHKLGSIRTLK